MIQLTGDLDFNIDCRARAQQMGMLLNEYGLWRWIPNPGKEDPEIKAQHLPEDGHWELVASETEERVLEEIGLPWIEPEKRNFSYLRKDGGGSKKKGRGRPRKSATDETE